MKVFDGLILVAVSLKIGGDFRENLEDTSKSALSSQQLGGGQAIQQPRKSGVGNREHRLRKFVDANRFSVGELEELAE